MEHASRQSTLVQVQAILGSTVNGSSKIRLDSGELCANIDDYKVELGFQTGNERRGVVEMGLQGIDVTGLSVVRIKVGSSEKEK